MGDQGLQARHGKASKGANDAAPMTLSSGDHTSLVDLLLQEASQAAGNAVTQADATKMIIAASQAVARTKVALDAYTIPDSSVAPKQLLRTVDGAFMGLYDLYNALHDKRDAGAIAYAEQVQAIMVAMSDRFSPFGWKVPRSDVEGHARAKGAARVGLTSISTSEKGQLGRLHIRAARQYLLGAWDAVMQGNFGGAATAAQNLHEAAAILIDPHFAQEIDVIANELDSTENVFGRFVMSVEQNDTSRLSQLSEVARQLDALRRVVGREPRWQVRVTTPAPAPASPTNTQANAPQPGQAPSAQTPGLLPAGNELDRGAPRAEPGMHRIVEMRNWTKKVHIKDTNYVDEYLGYIELAMEAYKTASGQVYISKATATKKLEDRAGQYLSMGANVVANSVELNGKRFADVFFDVQIGGPNTTETTAIGLSAKLTGSNSDKSAGGEVGASVVFSTATTSQGTRAFRRAFRISSLAKPQKVMTFDPADPYTPKLVEMGMIEDERADMHADFEDFELDDDDVGDTVTSFYANWILHSYSD